MSFFNCLILLVLIYIGMYLLIDRICLCIERKAMIKAHGEKLLDILAKEGVDKGKNEITYWH